MGSRGGEGGEVFREASGRRRGVVVICRRWRCDAGGDVRGERGEVALRHTVCQIQRGEGVLGELHSQGVEGCGWDVLLLRGEGRSVDVQQAQLEASTAGPLALTPQVRVENLQQGDVGRGEGEQEEDGPGGVWGAVAHAERLEAFDDFGLDEAGEAVARTDCVRFCAAGFRAEKFLSIYSHAQWLGADYY